jgi:hypothetical protein
MSKFKTICAVITFMMTMILPAKAQNLTASQMNIYFGSPKKVTMANSQGTTITEFDRDGRITKAMQGNMSINYDWSEDGTEVTISMYQGANLQDNGTIKIIENTPYKLKYNIGEVTTVDISFKKNGVLDTVVTTNPQMSGTMTYYYKQSTDVYPYAIEQTSGNRSAVVSVTIDEIDSYGNAIAFTQDLWGNKYLTNLTIEYY